jgi:hypothetical protein
MSFDPRGLIQTSLLSLMNSVDLELITSNSVITAHIVLSGELNDFESMRKMVSSQMVFPAFEWFSAALSPLHISFISLSNQEIEASSVDSFIPIPGIGYFKIPEQPDWREKLPNDLAI